MSIIGRAWRLNEHQGKGDARAQTKRKLVEYWGMTSEEAEAMSRHRPSYICIVLRDQGTMRLGVLFMDASDRFAFGDDAQAQALAGEIERLCNQGVRVVGTRTAGVLLGARGFLLSDGSLLVLAVSDVRVDGERLERRGVTPDIEVPYRLPYAAGRDAQLEAALAELARAS